MVDAALTEPKWLTTEASWSSAYPDHDLHYIHNPLCFVGNTKSFELMVKL